jgi:uncharacterized membrane protein
MQKLWETILNAFNYIGDNSGCHQIPERCFTIKGYTFPICARCTGVFIGQTAFIIALLLKRTTPFWLVLIFALVMLIDWSIQYFKIKESNNLRRLITGIFGGFGVWNIFFVLIVKIFYYAKERIL